MISYQPVYEKYKREKEIYELAVERGARDIYLGILFVAHADKGQYGAYQTKVHEDYVDGYFHYPSSANDAFRLLNDHTPTDANSGNGRGNGGGGNGGGGNGSGGNGGGRNNQSTASAVSLLQSDATPGSDGRLFSGTTCFKCQSRGHYADFCPQSSRSSSAVQLLQARPAPVVEGDDGSFAINFSQVGSSPPPALTHEWQGVPRSMLVLDSGSSINTYNNSELLTNIRRDNVGVTSLTNAESTTYQMRETFQGLLDVWYDPDGRTSSHWQVSPRVVGFILIPLRGMLSLFTYLMNVSGASKRPRMVCMSMTLPLTLILVTIILWITPL